MSQRDTANPWLETVKTLGLSVVLALGIRHFVAEARYIPSQSMQPTLQVNDRLLVEKLSYRFGRPERGDIIVFSPPESLQFEQAFIKRVIGLPGETVAVRNGTVFINGQAIQEPYLKAEPDYTYGPVEIPKRRYLVLGDNRNNSRDSHYWGFVPRKNIIGHAFVRFWPPDRLGQIADPEYSAVPERRTVPQQR
ncbi:MAG: signal peptidase I [Cyanobacteria bacterium QS_8_64_29]|nr:MAG: signal peptidase I [Cyanobacteria bacterium QS_8_64_29]